MSFQISFGPISWLMVSEIFPIRMRGRGISLAVLTNFGSNAIVTFAFYPLKVFIVEAGLPIFIAFCFFFLLFYHDWYQSASLSFLGPAGVSGSRKPFPSFWSHCFVITSVRRTNCSRNQRFEFGRNRIQNLEVIAKTDTNHHHNELPRT